MFTTSAQVPKKGHDFLKNLDNVSFSENLKKYGGYSVRSSFWKQGINRVKQIIKKTYKKR